MWNNKKCNRIKVLSIIIIAITGLLISGCSAEEDTWKAATEAGTIEGYEEYLGNYPEGKYVSEANEGLAWEIAFNEDTIKSYDQYLKKYPKGIYVNKALELIEGKLIPGTLKAVILDKATGEPIDLTKYTFLIGTKGTQDDLTQFEKEARENNELEWDTSAPGEFIIKNILPGEYSLLYMTESIFDLERLIETISIKPGQSVDLGIIEMEVNED